MEPGSYGRGGVNNKMLMTQECTGPFPRSFPRSLLCRLYRLVPLSGTRPIRNPRAAAESRRSIQRRAVMKNEDPWRSPGGVVDEARRGAGLAPGGVGDLLRSLRW